VSTMDSNAHLRPLKKRSHTYDSAAGDEENSEPKDSAVPATKPRAQSAFSSNAASSFAPSSKCTGAAVASSVSSNVTFPPLFTPTPGARPKKFQLDSDVAQAACEPCVGTPFQSSDNGTSPGMSFCNVTSSGLAASLSAPDDWRLSLGTVLPLSCMNAMNNGAAKQSAMHSTQGSVGAAFQATANHASEIYYNEAESLSGGVIDRVLLQVADFAKRADGIEGNHATIGHVRATQEIAPPSTTTTMPVPPKPVWERAALPPTATNGRARASVHDFETQYPQLFSMASVSAHACSCKRSTPCLTMYCGCFRAGLVCNAAVCKCKGCGNFPGARGREMTVAACLAKDANSFCNAPKQQHGLKGYCSCGKNRYVCISECESCAVGRQG
jgi:hypothetical protein